MKENIKKSLTLILLVILSLSSSHIVSAHTHTYKFILRNTTYKAIDDVSHSVDAYTAYDCSCGDIKIIYDGTSSAQHSYNGYTYTKNHYHSGARHYYELLSSCSYCSYNSYNWQVISCSGPPCSVPY